MQLLTERLFLIPLQPDGMPRPSGRTTDPELIQPYTDMLDLSLSHPEQWVWYTAWGLYQNDSGDWVGDLCFKGLPENGQPEIGYGLLPEYEHQGYATEAVRAALPLGLRTARRHRPSRRDRPRSCCIAGSAAPGGLCSDRDCGQGRAEVYSAPKALTPSPNQRFPPLHRPQLVP